MQVESHHSETLPAAATAESRGDRLRRHGRRTGLYTWAVGLVALLVVLIALVVANTRQVKLSWVVGTGHASLVWIILAAAVLGWLLGILTSEIFRLRTRRGRPA
jgi:uncharacterized integral membrane protein